MVDRSQERLNDHGFNDLVERSSYRCGYADGYEARLLWKNNPERLWPKAYLMGFKEGKGDFSYADTDNGATPQ
jgi:hypothetical protein